MNKDFSEIEKLLTPGAVNSQVKHWYLQFYLSFMATKVYSFLFFLNEVSIFLTKTDGAVKLWKQLQEEYSLANKLKF